MAGNLLGLFSRWRIEKTWIEIGMKLSKSTIVLGIILLLAIGLTLASLEYVRPAVCNSFCDLPKGVPCPSGSCRSGEQGAGFPVPIIIDSGAGSSPTSGWGKLGPEDPANPVGPALDFLFYSALLWLIWKIIQATWKKSSKSY